MEVRIESGALRRRKGAGVTSECKVRRRKVLSVEPAVTIGLGHEVKFVMGS